MQLQFVRIMIKISSQKIPYHQMGQPVWGVAFCKAPIICSLDIGHITVSSHCKLVGKPLHPCETDILNFG